MFRIYPNEKFKEFFFPEQRRRYAISNKGRMVTFTETPEDGTLLRGSSTGGYRTIRFPVKVKDKTISSCLFYYKLVAEHFVPKTSDDQQHIIHLDYKRDNDVVSNLKWVTRKEMLAHGQKSPNVLKARARRVVLNTTADGWKLSMTKVMHIKKLLSNPDRKTRLKILAKQFGVSETHLKRIERGENWGHIKV